MLNTCFETAAPLTVNVFICFMEFSPIISIFAGHEIFFHIIIKPSALCQNIPISELPWRQPNQVERGKTWGVGGVGDGQWKWKWRRVIIEETLLQTDWTCWEVHQMKWGWDAKQSRFKPIWNGVQWEQKRKKPRDTPKMQWMFGASAFQREGPLRPVSTPR